MFGPITLPFGAKMLFNTWRSFEDHERSHANELFTRRFAALAAMCAETNDLGYDMLWQGQAEQHRT